MSIYTDIAGTTNPTSERIFGTNTGRLLTGAMIILAVYGWVKSPPIVRWWLFLIFFGIPIPALLLFNVSPFLTLACFFPWLYVVIHSAVWVTRQDRHLLEAQQQAASQQAYQQAVDQRVAYEADRQATAQATGQAVVDAMRQAYQETQQAPTAPAGASHTRRNVVDVPALPPAPQGPTGPSQRPTGPPPPMGSTTPTLWVPTYSGAAKPVQRVETSLGGTRMTDRRRIDPDEL